MTNVIKNEERAEEKPHCRGDELGYDDDIEQECFGRIEYQLVSLADDGLVHGPVLFACGDGEHVFQAMDYLLKHGADRVAVRASDDVSV